MLDYQKRRYNSYFVMLPNGETIKVSRTVCFAPPDDGEGLKQRWYFSPDGEMAVRLPRIEESELLHRSNRADLRYEERAAVRTTQCIAETPLANCAIM